MGVKFLPDEAFLLNLEFSGVLIESLNLDKQKKDYNDCFEVLIVCLFLEQKLKLLVA